MKGLIPHTENLGRYREIAAVLTRHGFGWLFAESGTPTMRRRVVGRGDVEPRTRAVHLRLAFAELGTTFIKAAQVLSTRSDLLPPEYIAELAKLQDAAPVVPYPQLRAVFEAERGAAPEQVFATFDPVPLATASIGQVHAATLPDGTEVVVKIQRPGVAAAVERDIAVLLELADLAAQHSSFGRENDARGLVEEFAFTLRCELSYLREGQNADRFRKAFADDPDLHIPRIYWDYTTERVLVMERLRGVKIDDVPGLVAAGLDPRRVAAASVRLMLEEIFAHGFFHADPHPGNLFVLADGRIGMLDFGMVGWLDDALQVTITRLFMALARGDSGRMLDELLASGIAQGEVNRAALARDLDHLIICYKDRAAQDLAAAHIFGELTGLARRHHLRLPSDLVLMTKVLAISEGTGLQLDPQFQFIPFARPYLERFWLEKRSPARLGRRVAEELVELADLGLALPRQLRRLLVQVERGELGARVEVRGLDRAVGALQGMVNRLAMSILVGALIVGLSQFLHMAAPAGVGDYAGRFFGGLFVAVTVLGLWLLWGLLRSQRR